MHECQRAVKSKCTQTAAFVSRQRITQCSAVERASEADKSPVNALVHEQMSLGYDILKTVTYCKMTAEVVLKAAFHVLF